MTRRSSSPSIPGAEARGTQASSDQADIVPLVRILTACPAPMAVCGRLPVGKWLSGASAVCWSVRPCVRPSMRLSHAPLAMMPFARTGSRPEARTRSAPAKEGFPVLCSTRHHRTIAFLAILAISWIAPVRQCSTIVVRWPPENFHLPSCTTFVTKIDGLKLSLNTFVYDRTNEIYAHCILNRYGATTNNDRDIARRTVFLTTFTGRNDERNVIRDISDIHSFSFLCFLNHYRSIGSLQLTSFIEQPYLYIPMATENWKIKRAERQLVAETQVLQISTPRFSQENLSFNGVDNRRSLAIVSQRENHSQTSETINKCNLVLNRFVQEKPWLIQRFNGSFSGYFCSSCAANVSFSGVNVIPQCDNYNSCGNDSDDTSNTRPSNLFLRCLQHLPLYAQISFVIALGIPAGYGLWASAWYFDDNRRKAILWGAVTITNLLIGVAADIILDTYCQ